MHMPLHVHACRPRGRTAATSSGFRSEEENSSAASEPEERLSEGDALPDLALHVDGPGPGQGGAQQLGLRVLCREEHPSWHAP